MALQKVRRKYGRMIQLRLEHMTEYIRNHIAKKFKTASVVTAIDQGHLDNMILLVQLISIILFLVCQSYPGYLRIRLIYKPEFCYNGTNCSHEVDELLFRPIEAHPGYRGIWESLQRVTKLLPQYTAEDKEIESFREEIKTYWMMQMSTWPLEPICMIIILAMDVVRRSFCRRLHKRDTTVMFSMTGLMLCLCVLRICGIYLYFAILRRANSANCERYENASMTIPPVIYVAYRMTVAGARGADRDIEVAVAILSISSGALAIFGCDHQVLKPQEVQNQSWSVEESSATLWVVYCVNGAIMFSFGGTTRKPTLAALRGQPKRRTSVLILTDT
ncbi:hypothetical protein CLF_105996 [Clonorchis sinensis]|uniref:Uncharacterized protein n=1 Tax=Clonorchis sinensis TaxID=79923 RepID=G7YEI3_CLOSI|nr:hypothetical protein CLF_105996 [Clonorchis sinensis]